MRVLELKLEEVRGQTSVWSTERHGEAERSCGVGLTFRGWNGVCLKNTRTVKGLANVNDGHGTAMCGGA